MTERPIIMQAHEVRAILDGRKTQTRRVAKVRNELPPAWATFASEGHAPMHDGTARPTGLFYWSEEQTPGEPLKPLRRWPIRPEEHPLGGDGYWTPSPFGQPGDRLLVCAPIPSSPNDDYCAGSDGHIYSRTRYAGFGRKKRTDWYPLIGHRDKRKGYVRVSLCHENTKVTRSIHSLICESFYGPAPFHGAQVRHLDGNPQNNLPDNLAWGTSSENWADRRLHGNGVEGEKHPQAKLRDEERAHLRWALEHGLCSGRHAARSLGLAQATVCQIMNACELRTPSVEAPMYRVPRILLEVTDVRVERLQAISEADARAEGLPWSDGEPDERGVPTALVVDARDEFRHLWDSLNAARGHGWDTNPWVWCITFRRVTP